MSSLSKQQAETLGISLEVKPYPSLNRWRFSTPINGLCFCTTQFGHHLIKVLDVKESGATVPQMQSIRVDEVKQYVDAASKDVNLIDCREENEFAIAKVDGFLLYPLSQAEKWQMTIEMDVDPEKDYCYV